MPIRGAAAYEGSCLWAAAHTSSPTSVQHFWRCTSCEPSGWALTYENFFKDLEQEKNREVQLLLEQVHWSDADLQVKRNAALDSYLRRRHQDGTYGGVVLIGILGELACVHDTSMAAAVAALLDDDLQALVVATEVIILESLLYCDCT